MLVFLLVAAAEFSAATHANLTCTTRSSCSNNGDCINQQCVCDKGYFGPTCSTVAAAAAVSAVVRPSSPPRVTYRHNYNRDGHSHWAECSFSHFASQDFIPGVKPFFVDTTTNTSLPPHRSNGTQIKAQKLVWLDPKYHAHWHQEPAVQLIAVISGHGEWINEEGGAGAVQRFGPGDLYLGDDRGTAKGHRSRTVGGKPLVTLVTQFAIPSDDASGGHANHPCWL